MGLAGRGNPIYSHQLSGGASSSRSVAVTPAATDTDVQWSCNDIPDTELVGARTEFVQIVGFRFGHLFTFDQAASGGAVVNADKLKKLVTSIQVTSSLCGNIFAAQHTKGAPVSHFDSVAANDWFDYQPHRAQIAAADGDTVVYLETILPVALGCMNVPEDFALPPCCFNPGNIVVRGYKSTVFDGDSTGAVIKSVTLTAEALYILTPDPTIGVPHQFCEYAPPGASNNPELTGLGQAKGINADMIDASAAGLAALIILGDATGIGLGGADGPDNILSVDIPALRIRNHTDPRSFQRNTRLVLPSTNFGHRAGFGSTIEHDAADGLYTQASTPNDPLDAQAKWFQIFAPVSGQQSSKVHAWQPGAPLKVNLTTTTPAANVFRTGELLKWSKDAKLKIMAAMGFNPARGWTYRPKMARPHNGPVPAIKGLFFPDEIVRG